MAEENKKKKGTRVFFNSNSSNGQPEKNPRGFGRSLGLNGQSNRRGSAYTDPFPNAAGFNSSRGLERTQTRRWDTAPSHFQSSQRSRRIFSQSISTPLSSSGICNHSQQAITSSINNFPPNFQPKAVVSVIGNNPTITERTLVKTSNYSYYSQIVREGDQNWKARNRRNPLVERTRKFNLELIKSVVEIGIRLSIFLRKDVYRLSQWKEIIESKFTLTDPITVFFNELSLDSWIRFFSDKSFDFRKAEELYDLSQGGISDLKNDAGRSFKLLDYKFRAFLEPVLKKDKGFYLDLNLKLGYQYLFSWKKALLTMIDIEDRSLNISCSRQQIGKQPLSAFKLERQLAYYLDENKYKKIPFYCLEEREGQAGFLWRRNEKTNREIVKKWCLLDDGLLIIEDSDINIEINVNLFAEALMKSNFGVVSNSSKSQNDKDYYSYWDIFILETGIFVDEDYRNSLVKSLVGVVEKKIQILTYYFCPYSADNDCEETRDTRKVIEFLINEKLSFEAYPNHNSEETDLCWLQEATHPCNSELITIQNFHELFQSIKLLCTILEEPSFKVGVTVFLQDKFRLKKIFSPRGPSLHIRIGQKEFYDNLEKLKIAQSSSFHVPSLPEPRRPRGSDFLEIQQEQLPEIIQSSSVHIPQEDSLRSILAELLPDILSNILEDELKKWYDSCITVINAQRHEKAQPMICALVDSKAGSFSSSNNEGGLLGKKSNNEEKGDGKELAGGGEIANDNSELATGNEKGEDFLIQTQSSLITKLSTTTKTDKTDDNNVIVSKELNNIASNLKNSAISNNNKNNTKQLIIVATAATFSSSLLLILIKKIATIFFYSFSRKLKKKVKKNKIE